MRIKGQWKQYWAYSSPPRKSQAKALNEFCDGYNMGFRNFVIHAPVGCGKSGIGMTIANMLGTSYIATSTTQLQSQYVEDFGVNQIKGRRHYPCNFQLKKYDDSWYDSLKEYSEEEHGIYCDTCIIQEAFKKDLDWRAKLDIIQTQNNNPDYLYNGIIEKGLEEKAMDNHKLNYCLDCQYQEAVMNAKCCDYTVTNYFMLNALFQYLKFPPRNALIFDEAHNFERNLIQLFSFTIKPYYIKSKHGCELFEGYYKGIYKYKDLLDLGNMEKIISDYQFFIGEEINKLEKKYGISIDTNSDKKYGIKDVDALVNEFNKTRSLLSICQYDYILSLPDEEKLKKGLSKDDEITFRPRYIGDYANYFYNYAEYRIFMTGTLGSVEEFCKKNGLNHDETYYIKINSDFPVGNRPIHKSYFKYNLPKFSNSEYYIKNNQGKVIKPKRIRPEIINAIQDIIQDHPNQKGLIHTNSHTDTLLIKEQLDYPYIWTVTDAENNYNHYPRDKIISCFKESDDPIVLVGAGLKDGIDLPYDYCRFNIIFKVPYPGDQYSRQRGYGIPKDYGWYVGETCNPMMQAYGRGMRTKTDYCDTYILDECLEDILKKQKYLLEDYFLEGIRR